MSVRFSWTVQDAHGEAVTNADVDLYYNGGAKLADMTNNNDGSYYCAVAVSGKYDVKVGGVAQDEGTGIWIEADDRPTAAAVALKADKVTAPTNGNLAGLDANGNLTDSAYAPSSFLGSAHVNANGAGGTLTPATNKVHNAAAIAVVDAGGLLAAAEVEAALAEIMGKIGTMGISTGSFIAGLTNITDCLLALNNQLYDLYLRGGDTTGASSNSFKQHYIFTLSGNSGASGDFGMGQIAAAAEGFYPLRDGYVSGISASWEAHSMATTSIDIKYYPGGTTLLTIDSADAAALCKRQIFTDQNVIATSLGNNSLAYTRTTGSGYLTDLIVLVEITYGLASS
jgi:hypothetical protein